jgi:prevent-host-death family protein
MTIVSIQNTDGTGSRLGGSCVEIAAGKFKAQCLQLMDLVHDTHQRVVITKHGRPVAQLVAMEQRKPRPVFGRLRGRIESYTDLSGPLPNAWPRGERGRNGPPAAASHT